MINLTDILKQIKDKERQIKKQEPSAQPRADKPEKEASPIKDTPPTLKQPDQEKSATLKFRISPVVKERTKADSGQERIGRIRERVRLYEGTLSSVEKILKQVLKDGEKISYKILDETGIFEHIEKLVDCLTLSNEDFLTLALNGKAGKPEDADVFYINRHLVNTCVFSIIIGVAMGYEKSKLVDLGISTIVHDVYMITYLDLINQPRKLTAEEMAEIMKHPEKGVGILKGLGKALPEIAIQVTLQHHERIDGSGYPKGLRENEINEFAKIIGFADVYEALTHDRPHRASFNCFDALKIILKERGSFDSKIIKVFLERIGIFPVGTLVELSTKETAQIIRHNPKSPFAPKVLVTHDAQKSELTHPKEIDLTKTPTIYITKSLLGADVKKA